MSLVAQGWSSTSGPILNSSQQLTITCTPAPHPFPTQRQSHPYKTRVIVPLPSGKPHYPQEKTPPLAPSPVLREKWGLDVGSKRSTVNTSSHRSGKGGAGITGQSLQVLQVGKLRTHMGGGLTQVHTWAIVQGPDTHPDALPTEL